ncbi:hypothetical protein Trydic_g21174 [Trypoxylus dichotomus]
MGNVDVRNSKLERTASDSHSTIAQSRSKRLDKPSCPEVVLVLSFLSSNKVPNIDKSGFKCLINEAGVQNVEDLNMSENIFSNPAQY